MKRLNVKLAAWLVGATLILIVGVHFLHGYQVNRNADVLRVQAEKADADGDVKEAIAHYSQFLKYRDEAPAYSALSRLVVQAAEDPSSSRAEKYRAYTVLQEAIRRHPDLQDVRRRLVDYTFLMRQIQETLEHIGYLTNAGIKDPALDFTTAQCYWYNGEEDRAVKKLQELVGMDPTTGEFQATPGHGAQQIDAFVLLAQILLRRGQKDLSNETMQKLVEWNSDSHKAHLKRGVYLNNTTGAAAAKAELEMAYQLAPEEAEVLLVFASFAIAEKNRERAKQLLDRAEELYPKRQDVYLRKAQLAGEDRDSKAGIAHLERGLERAGETRDIYLLLVEFQLQAGDTEAVRATCAKMRNQNFPSELVRFTEARAVLADGDYWSAAKQLEVVRPSLVNQTNSNFLHTLDIHLGQCYENMGQPDRQLEVYRRLLQSAPTLVNARLGFVSASQALGKTDDVERSLKVMVDDADSHPQIHLPLLQQLINFEQQKPTESRNWSNVETIAAKIYARPNRLELENTLLKAELLMLQEQFSDAQTLLMDARGKFAKEPRVWSMLLRLLVRQNRMDRVGQLLDLAEQSAGPNSSILADRIWHVGLQGGDEVKSKLGELSQKVDSFPEAERPNLYSRLATGYLQAGDYATAKKYWKLIAKAAPANANLRQYMYEMAMSNRDDEGMKELTEEVRQMPQLGPTSALYKYCLATQMLVPIQRRTDAPRTLSVADRNTIAEAHKLIDEAIAVRGEWNPLWRVRAEIDQLEGNIDAAITNYQKAIQLGTSNQPAIARRLVQLLYANRRYTEANQLLQMVGQLGAADPLKKIEQHLQAETGNVEEAIASARKEAQEDSKNPANHLWLGQLLAQSSRDSEAEASFRQAVVVGPDLPQAWDMLVRHLVNQNKLSDAREVIGQAAPNLNKQPMVLARLYGHVNDLEQAEQYYKLAMEAAPNDPAPVQAAIEFYFAAGQAAKAQPLLEAVIQKTSKSTEEADQKQLAWARRRLAAIVAETRDYQHTLEATKLIDQNAKNGKLAPEDATALVDLLSGRPELDSRARAISLLETLSRERPLNPREQFVLGQLYNRAGNWTRSKDLVLSAVSRQSTSADMLLAYCGLLYQHEEYSDASRWIERLEELLSTTSSRSADRFRRASREIKARLQVKNGQRGEAVKTLQSLVPSPLPPNELPLLGDVARIMEDLELYDDAEKLLREYSQLDPRGLLALAVFHGRRGNVNQAFAMFEESRKSQPITDITLVAMEVLRSNPEQATPEQFQKIESWATAGLELGTDPASVQLLLAEVYDLQGRPAEAIKIYRDLLATKDLRPMQNAVVNNNLAYQLAVGNTGGSSASEALKLIEEAIKVLGPTSDLIDTRGLAYLAAGELPKAVSDLQSAVSDSPSSTKYLHLALAQAKSNRLDAARDSFAKAQQQKLDVNRLAPSDKKNYNQLVEQLK